MEHIQIFSNTLLHITGGDNGSGPWYLEESGFIALAGFITYFSGWFRKHNCHKNWCWRLAKHKVGDGKFVVCKVHHPEMGRGFKVKPEHIQHAHEAHKKYLKSL